jgi:hypothetical protein
MKTDNILIQELIKLNASYRARAVHLNTLASHSETLLEKMQSALPDEDFARAMNCVYLIEEINAIVLDESRQPTHAEQKAIENEMAILEKIIGRNCETDGIE